MSLRLDINNLPEQYTLILSRRNHKHFGQIVNIDNLNFKNNLSSVNEISFDVYKELDGIKETFWKDITDFKFVYVVELDEYYEIKVDLTDSSESIKSITGASACECELSQSYLYGLEINTDIDISRDDYAPTVLFNPQNKEASLLHRVLQKLPHYSILHVDESITNIQRTFNAEGTTVYDFLTQEVAKEIDCIFIFSSAERGIRVYDLKTLCKTCGERGDFNFVCPKCDSKNLKYFGEDTVIFVDTENLSDSITFTTDTDSVKNCFKLEAGDDNMTAAVTNLNPNGSSYLYYFSKDLKKDMSVELVNKIEAYEKLSESFKSTYAIITENIYNCINKIVYYTSGMMPTIQHEDTNSLKEARKLTVENLSPIGLTKVSSSTSTSTVNSALKNFAKVFINSGKFKIDVHEGNFEYLGEDSSGYNMGYWTGGFKITNYSDEEDVAYSDVITIKVYDSYEAFLNQKIKKKISSGDDDGSIFSVLDIDDITRFKSALKLYCLNRLISFNDAIQGVIDIMIEEDQSSDGATFNSIYVKYKEKLEACQYEIDQRSYTISSYEASKKESEKERNRIQSILNFENYIGVDLYREFCCFRREDKYTNSNYISDGLNDDDIFKRAKEFLDAAEKELYKSGEHQHSITASLYNLLAMKEFKPLSKKFELGNWIRVRVDEDVCRLRLISYQISFNDLTTIDVEFSDVLKTRDGISDIQSILNQTSSMASTYDSVVNQVKNDGDKIKVVDGWVQNGLDATNTMITNNLGEQSLVLDKHGLLCRRYDDIEEDYDDCQLKIINNGLYTTSDNWKSINNALGKYVYVDPLTKQMRIAYGLQGKEIVGEMIAGEKLSIRSKDNSFVIDENGVRFGSSSVEEVIEKIDNSIISIDVEYYISTSDTEAIGGVWSAISPTFVIGRYLWTRQVIRYADGTSTVNNVARISTSSGKGVAKIIEEYAKSDSPTVKPLTGWQETSPRWEPGIYIWTRTRIEYSDGTEYTSVPACITGNPGEDAFVYSIEILSSNGNIFKNSNIETTLTCKVYKNNEDITDMIPIQNFHWEKINSNGSIDTEWNNKYFGGAKSIKITKEDVFRRATFNCRVDGII